MNTDNRLLLVFFCSERSGPSRRMESVLAHLARKQRDRLRIKQIDVDANPELTDRFHVEEVPTIVLVKERRAIERLAGRASAPRIQSLVEPHLPSPVEETEGRAEPAFVT